MKLPRLTLLEWIVLGMIVIFGLAMIMATTIVSNHFLRKFW